jgi:MoaA/NifB/PqqE/SkfB family radical SAM enzyme
MIVRAGNPDYTIFMFTWMLTNWCNYQCEYCCEKTRLVSDWQKEDSISRYKLTLSKLKRFDKPFQIELYGGEPTLHPNLAEILHTLKQIAHCKNVYIITNMSRPLAYFKQLDVPELDGVYVMASFHPDYYTNDFLEKVRAINEMDHLRLRVTVNLSDQSDHWPTTVGLIKALEEQSIDYGLHFLNSTDTWTSNYSAEFFKLFSPLQKSSKHLYDYEFDDGTVRQIDDLEIYEKNYHRFKGYTCTPRFYEIDLDSTIRNMCTRAEFNIPLITGEKIERTVSCPNDCCGCEIMFNARKEL